MTDNGGKTTDERIAELDNLIRLTFIPQLNKIVRLLENLQPKPGAK